ncbi:MAG: hypothetical protein JNM72_26395 [Deltaproteobacteria bacterium]|nr:hypothetical protein [Deltaproteobacteria bacterium]
MSRTTLGSLAFSCVLMLHLVGLIVAFDGHHNVGPILVAEGVGMIVVSAAWPADPAPGGEGRPRAGDSAAARGLTAAIIAALGEPGVPPRVRAVLVSALGRHGVDLEAR